MQRLGTPCRTCKPQFCKYLLIPKTPTHALGILSVAEVRSLISNQHLLLQKSGTDALLMPEIRPLGDVDPEEMIFAEAEAGLTGLSGALPSQVPAISGIERDISLMSLVQAWLETSGRAGGLASASKLTAELTALLDSLQIEEVDTSQLNSLVPGEFSHNWQQTLEFLKILTSAWPLLFSFDLS